MSRQIEIEFPKSHTRAVAALHDEWAPKTCAAIWAVLEQPVERMIIHAISSGENVLFYNLPPIDRPQELPLENHKIRPGAGEIMYFYQPAGRLAGLRSVADWLHPSGEVHEVVFSYGHTDLSGPAVAGWRGSHWATVVENLEGFIRACRTMRIEGAQTIVLRRLP